jgi:hypothetical protein
MIFVGLISLLGIKLPMPQINKSVKQGNDVMSVFTLGLFSGITSSCCAPVLVGVLTLSVLSPTLWQALLIGFVYVLGMVTPLYVGSYFLDSKRVLGATFFRKKLGELKLFSKTYPVVSGNFISFLIFTVMGGLVVYLTLVTDFSMAEMADGFSDGINSVATKLDSIPGINVLFLILAAGFVFLVVRQALRDKNGSAGSNVEGEEGTDEVIEEKS